MSDKKRASSAPKRKRAVSADDDDDDDDVQVADSGGESDDNGPQQLHHATSESELSEAKRLKSLAYSKRLLQDGSKAQQQQSVASLPISRADEDVVRGC